MTHIFAQTLIKLFKIRSEATIESSTVVAFPFFIVTLAPFALRDTCKPRVVPCFINSIALLFPLTAFSYGKKKLHYETFCREFSGNIRITRLLKWPIRSIFVKWINGFCFFSVRFLCIRFFRDIRKICRFFKLFLLIIYYLIWSFKNLTVLIAAFISWLIYHFWNHIIFRYHIIFTIL